MRRKRGEATAGVAQLDHASLKPGRKSSTTGNRSNLLEHEKRADERNSKRQKPQNQHTPSDTQPYKIQRELEQLEIDADYLQENGPGLIPSRCAGPPHAVRPVPSNTSTLPGANK
jgi:hypothetical protein